MRVPLTEMKSGESGIVVNVLGGHGFVSRLNAMGIRLCKKITKVSSMLMRGPITINVDNTTIAIGHGMAQRIIVEVDYENPADGKS